MATEARTESTPRRTSGMGPGSPQSQPRGGRNPSGVGGIPHGKTSRRTWNGEGALEPSPGEIGRSGAGGGGSMQQAASVMPRAQHNTTTNMARAGLGGVGGGEGSTVQVYAARWSGTSSKYRKVAMYRRPRVESICTQTERVTESATQRRVLKTKATVRVYRWDVAQGCTVWACIHFMHSTAVVI